jgi:sarcosine oxidase subunit alpha
MPESQAYRLPAGGRIDRSRLLGFTFDGRRYHGHPGDTLASALLANGVRLVGRSFKYHRPRGIASSGPEEPNALVSLRSGARHEPNTRATTVELYDGLHASTQNCWPSVSFDIKAILQFAGPLIAAGFYYKTFMWPPAFWEKVYEPLIRRAAGLGMPPAAPDPDRYEKATVHCDVLVVGSGAAGLAGALAAARMGARVLLCEEDFRLGGRLLSERQHFLNGFGDWIASAEAELRASSNVTILTRTSVCGTYDHGVYGAIERVADHCVEPAPFQPRQRFWRIVAKGAVLATGAVERPLLFGNNDVPGVMLAGAVRTYVNRYGVAPGQAAVLVTNNDDGWRTATDLAAAGVEVRAIVDSRPEGADRFANAAKAIGARVVTGTVQQAAGRRLARGVRVAGAGRALEIDCDLVAVSGGWNPNVHLASHLGGKPRWDERIAAYASTDLPRGLTLAGAAAGLFGLREALESGARAASSFAAAAGFRGEIPAFPETGGDEYSVEARLHLPKTSAKVFVDFQNDVLTTDLELAHREGFGALEHAKRYTTLGMGTDQGKTSNVNAIALLSGLQEKRMNDVGTTTFRPPYTPVAMGALAGHHRGKNLKPTRRTPAHSWASENGAVFTEAGLWLRAQHFPRNGEDWLSAACREALAVRGGVGLADVSTLGKIDVQGSDAVALLDRVYANSVSTLPTGRARYGVMLREDGFVFDDGTFARLGDTHFVVSTTTANARGVMSHLEYCAQVLWPEMDVALTSVTDQWAQFAVAGPRAREVLQKVLDPGCDVSNSAFPFMACGAVRLRNGVAGRLFRLSFSGELGYEIAVPARWGETLVRALMAAGHEHGITPYGLEAMSILRVEKGHAAGGELNGQTTARDLGIGRMASKKTDYIGRAMLERPGLLDPERPALVGLRTLEDGARLNAGAHFVGMDARLSAEEDQGHVTSVAYSPTLKRWIGLGLLRRGQERIGERVRAADPVRNLDVPVEITAPCFIDLKGDRLRV